MRFDRAGCGYSGRAGSQNVRVKHGRGDILVTEQLLHGSNVVSVLEQMRRKAVSEGVAAGWLLYARSANRQFHRVLQIFFRNVMTSHFA